MTDPAELTKRGLFLLDNAQFATLATRGGDLPWASTVSYVHLTDPPRLLWYSAGAARHSRNLTIEPRVSASFFMTGLPGAGLDGAQVIGTCREAPPETVDQIHRAFYELKFPDEDVRAEWILPVEQFTGDGPRRFYLLHIERFWLFDIDRWLVDKHDGRVELDLTQLHA